jgi:hypothetical protein
MTRELIERSRKRHEFADVALIVTTIVLVVSLVIAATTVSIGIARAGQAQNTVASHPHRG